MKQLKDVDVVGEDGTLYETFEYDEKRKKYVLGKDDGRRMHRREMYRQQAFVARALENERSRSNDTIVELDREAPKGQVKRVIDTVRRPPVCVCSRFTKGNADVKLTLQDGAARAHGLLRCKSVWTCPVCGSMLLRQRAEEIRRAVDVFHDAPKWMVTLTAKHDRKTDLKSFIKSFREARRRVSRNRKYIKFRRSAAGYIAAAEITWSKKNGWHWHVHELWFDCDKPDFFELWKDALEKEGLTCTTRGYDVRESWDASEYLAKYGKGRPTGRWDTAKEVASTKKGGTGVWELAETRPDLVRDHFHATRGQPRIKWSNGLKDLAGVEDVLDEEVIERLEAINDLPPVARIPWSTWKVWADRAASYQLLDALEIGGVDELEKRLAQGPKMTF